MKIKSHTSGVTHALAQCRQCDWESDEDFGSADKQAKDHVKETGHSVVVETCKTKSYERTST